jgi:hypothetical protein
MGDLIGGFMTPDYSYIENAVSELIQSGAENRIFLSAFMFLHAVMIIQFSIGILVHHPFHKSKSIHIAGLLLLAVGISHAFSSTIFPQDPVGTKLTLEGLMHIILVGITVLSIIIIMPLLGIGLSRKNKWNYFSAFTFICLAVILISGIGSPVAIRKGIAIIGLTERMTGYTFYLWLLILACLLLKKQTEKSLPASVQ